MAKKSIKERYSCFVFGEGKRDKDFLIILIDLPKFKYHTRKWKFNYSNSSGGSASTILEKCQKESISCDFDLTLCFMDLDKLKEDFHGTWNEEKSQLPPTSSVACWLDKSYAH